VRETAVSLNILRPWNVPGHNMRTFEIPGCGGLQLSTASSEVAGLFTSERELLMFRTVEDLRALVSWALEHPDERRAIAEAGHARVASETYLARAQRILQVCQEIATSAGGYR
jgi:spore maturation protein CgeB